MTRVPASSPPDAVRVKTPKECLFGTLIADELYAADAQTKTKSLPSNDLSEINMKRWNPSVSSNPVESSTGVGLVSSEEPLKVIPKSTVEEDRGTLEVHASFLSTLISLSSLLCNALAEGTPSFPF